MNDVNRRTRRRSTTRPPALGPPALGESGEAPGEDAGSSMSQQARQFGASAREAFRSCHAEAEAEGLLSARQNRSGQ